MKPDTDQPVVAERKPSSCAHSDWCARWVTDSVKLENRPMLGRLYDVTVPCSCGAEPVATLPACLCGLDTNPVASPRMDVHCPKHDAPGGEPELLPEQIVAMIKESVDCEYSDLVGYKARLGAALVDLKLLLNSRVSQPAGEPSDEEFNPWYENYEKALVAEVSSTATPADEEVARALVYDWTNYVGLTEDEALDGNTIDALVGDIATALTEVRRAGTPTTDACAVVEARRIHATSFEGRPDLVAYNQALDDVLADFASAFSSTPGKPLVEVAKGSGK